MMTEARKLHCPVQPIEKEGERRGVDPVMFSSFLEMLPPNPVLVFDVFRLCSFEEA
jgi:hypothetical protein